MHNVQLYMPLAVGGLAHCGRYPQLFLVTGHQQVRLSQNRQCQRLRTNCKVKGDVEDREDKYG